jgi:hypothetical protein
MREETEMTETGRQKRITGRVMHEFKYGELKSGPGGKAGPVEKRRQAIAIALSEAGASKYESDSKNRRNERKTERKEVRGETAQQEREGKSRIGARGERESTRAVGGANARKPTARGKKAARTRSRGGPTRQELYAEAQRKGVPGRSHMTKLQLENALGMG